MPAHVTALRKALLASRADADLDSQLHFPLVALTENTLTDRAGLGEALASARTLGVAWDREEACRGLACAATVVPGPREPTHAISVSVPTFRLSEELRRDLPDLPLELTEGLRVSLGALAVGIDPR